MVMIVDVEDRRIVKPYLGGWRHKFTDTEYFNATSQTGPRPNHVPYNSLCSVMVQTVETKDDVTQTSCHRPTQMWRHDYNLSNISDKYMTVKPYETYEEMMARLNFDGNARIIQKNYRIYRLAKYIKQCARIYREIIEDCKKYQEEKITMYRKRHQLELYRKVYPRTRTDFDMLYNLIERWRCDRLKDSKLHYFKAGHLAENYLILQKTIEMLNIIEKKKEAIREAYKETKRVKFITLNCIPIRWVGYNSNTVEMVTLKTQKAREFNRMYKILRKNNINMEERMEILIMLKRSLEFHICLPSFDLMYLLDQEIMLLSRGIKNLSLTYLRKRILCNYLKFVSSSATCACLRSEEEKGGDCEKLEVPLETRTIFCKSCNRLLPHHRFTIDSSSKKKLSCKSCTWLREWNCAHVNYEPYAFLLSHARTEKRKYKSTISLSFAMNVRDMYYLVNIIWHGRSIASDNDDIYALRMIKYHQNIDWSPWNCILLTEEEIENHLRAKDFRTIYSEDVLRQIYLKHLMAKNHFKNLRSFARNFEKSHYSAIANNSAYKKMGNNKHLEGMEYCYILLSPKYRCEYPYAS